MDIAHDTAALEIATLSLGCASPCDAVGLRPRGKVTCSMINDGAEKKSWTLNKHRGA